MKLYLMVLVLALTPSNSFAQQDTVRTSPCNFPEARQFDCWVGKWEASWGARGKGLNTISVILDSCAIQENFNGSPSIPLRGHSYSAYNKFNKYWQQTWVDNNGSYLDFKGGFEDGKMILTREAIRDTQRFHQRMVWFNIQKNSYDWSWDRSDDEGKTWKPQWQVKYRRVNTDESE